MAAGDWFLLNWTGERKFRKPVFSEVTKLAKHVLLPTVPCGHPKIADLPFVSCPATKAACCHSLQQYTQPGSSQSSAEVIPSELLAVHSGSGCQNFMMRYLIGCVSDDTKCQESGGKWRSH